MLNKKNKKFQIISLGNNCLPRTVLTRNGIKPNKFQGELTYPFDLAFFDVSEVTNNLHNDFANFFDNIQYEEMNNNKHYWIKPPGNIKFFHEKQVRNKEKLVKIYKKRIENFRNEIQCPYTIIFVQIIENNEDIYNTNNEIKRLRNNLPYKYLVIDTKNLYNAQTPENVKILKLAFPSQEYEENWWKRKYYNSKPGKIFEKQICDFVLKTIKEISDIV